VGPREEDFIGKKTRAPTTLNFSIVSSFYSRKHAASKKHGPHLWIRGPRFKFWLVDFLQLNAFLKSRHSGLTTVYFSNLKRETKRP